jgi:hypothetical protein
MVDDATGRWFARFVVSDSTVENMNLLESYVKKNGRPLAFYTGKASLFQTAEKRQRHEPGVDQDAVEMPPTQIGRALRELAISWIAAHSPQAKGRPALYRGQRWFPARLWIDHPPVCGRVERGFLTAQDRLVKGMRVAGVTTSGSLDLGCKECHTRRMRTEYCAGLAHRPTPGSSGLASFWQVLDPHPSGLSSPPQPFPDWRLHHQPAPRLALSRVRRKTHEPRPLFVKRSSSPKPIFTQCALTIRRAVASLVLGDPAMLAFAHLSPSENARIGLDERLTANRTRSL